MEENKLNMSKLEGKHLETDRLEKDLKELSIDNKRDSETEEIINAKTIDTDDDGYDSCSNNDQKETKFDLEDEKELEPLSIIPDSQPVVYILYNARGLQDHRFNPYARPQCNQNNTNIPQIVEPDLKENVTIFKPTVRILKRGENKIPSKLDATVGWTKKHKITIASCQLPEDTYYGEIAIENKVQLFIQLSPNANDLKTFMADVKTEFDSKNGRKKHFIGPIVIFLKTELAESQEKYLLDRTSMVERTDAYNLVGKKDLSHLTSGIRPHNDTVLAVLCAQRNPKKPGQTFAQIHAVIQRLVNHPEKRVKNTVFSLNNNQISAFEISAITNNSVVACYLAEVMYNLTDEAETALHILNCRDTQGNTIIHLLARKGDSNKETLKSLLDLCLSDGSNMFNLLPNSKKQYPMHIVTQSLTNQPETIKLLYGNMKKSFEVMDLEGMTALHYACQRSTDVELVRTILSYKKDNINVINKDGLSALDLISRRSSVTAQSQGLFLIEKIQQEEMIKLIKNNGGTTGKQPSEKHFPACEHLRVNTSGAMDYPVQVDGSSHSPPRACSMSPMGSPYSGQNSVGSPINISDPFLNSNNVEFYQQSSPESFNLGSPHSPTSMLSYQDSRYNKPESPSSHQSYEDQLAFEILTQFPEISNVLGQILEEDQ